MTIPPAQKSPLVRFIIIEAVLLTALALFCLVTGFNASLVFSIVGAVILTMRISSGPRYYQQTLGSRIWEQQYLKDAKDRRLFWRGQQIFNDLLLIGIVPLLIGIVLGFL